MNDELGNLKIGLRGAYDILEPGGYVAVISFHSLEDRIVKLAIRSREWQLVTKHPIVATENERLTNRRSRSAKLRIAQKKA